MLNTQHTHEKWKKGKQQQQQLHRDIGACLGKGSELCIQGQLQDKAWPQWSELQWDPVLKDLGLILSTESQK